MDKDVIFSAGAFDLHDTKLTDISGGLWLEFGQEYSCSVDDVIRLVNFLLESDHAEMDSPERVLLVCQKDWLD